MEKEKLVEWQEAMLKSNKKILMKEGHHPSVIFVITKRMNIEENLVKMFGLQNMSDEKSFEELQPKETVILGLDLEMDSSNLLYLFRTVHPDDAFSNVIDQFMLVGLGSGVKDPAKQIISAFLKANNMNIKDFVANLIIFLLKKVEAEALIKVDEAWSVQTDSPEKVEKFRDFNGPSLESHPDSFEVLMSVLEGDGFMRSVFTPILRKPAKNGKIVGFGDPRILDTGEPGHRAEGRFTNLLRESRQLETKKQTNPNLN